MWIAWTTWELCDAVNVKAYFCLGRQLSRFTVLVTLQHDVFFWGTIGTQ